MNHIQQIDDYIESAKPYSTNPPHKYQTKEEFEADVAIHLHRRAPKSYVAAVDCETQLREQDIGYIGMANLEFWYGARS